MSFESDNCNVMKGGNKGVIPQIRAKQPTVIDLGCICHLTNLCNVAAKRTLPVDVDQLLVNLYFYFDNR
jgi:hypothetical protein